MAVAVAAEAPAAEAPRVSNNQRKVAMFLSKKKTVVYIDEQSVRVVYAATRLGRVKVEKTLSFTFDSLDEFIKEDASKEYLLVVSFMDFYQETFTVPAVKKKYMSGVVESELERDCPFKDFSYVYTLSGPRAAENRKVVDATVFAVRSSEVNGLIERFTSAGKTVSAVYPDVYSLAGLVPETDEAVLCVTEAGPSKNIFLVSGGEVLFARTFASDAPRLDAPDVHNIEMTVNYCRQALRISPSRILLMGSLTEGSLDEVAPFSLPVVCQVPPSGGSAGREEVLTNLVPLSALSAARGIDISTAGHRSEYLVETVLGYSTFAFTAASVAAALLLVVQAAGLWSSFERLREAKAEVPPLEGVISRYQEVSNALRGYRPYLVSAVESAASPDYERFLRSLSSADTGSVSLESVVVKKSGPALLCTMKGVVEGTGLGPVQAGYQGLLDSLDGIEGVEVTGGDLSLRERRFEVEVSW